MNSGAMSRILATEHQSSYVRHWWKAMISLEGQLELRHNAFATQIENQSKTSQYRNLIYSVPALFGIAWIVLLIVGATRIGCYYLKQGIPSIVLTLNDGKRGTRTENDGHVSL